MTESAKFQSVPAKLMYAHFAIPDGVYPAAVTGNEVMADKMNLRVSLGDLYVKGISVPCNIHVSNHQYSVELNVRKVEDAPQGKGKRSERTNTIKRLVPATGHAAIQGGRYPHQARCDTA